MRKFDNIESCVEFLDSAVLPIIRNLDWGETLGLCVGCGEKDLCVEIDNYNKETDEISFEWIVTDLTGDVCVEDILYCKSMKLFLSKVRSFLQKYCLENLSEGHYIEVILNSIRGDDISILLEEDEPSELDAYLSDMADAYEDVDDDDLPF